MLGEMRGPAERLPSLPDWTDKRPRGMASCIRPPDVAVLHVVIHARVPRRVARKRDHRGCVSLHHAEYTALLPDAERAYVGAVARVLGVAPPSRI
jgi:hypothetical protein